MQRRIGLFVLSLPLLGGLAQPVFAEDAIGLESWRGRADEGNFAQEIAGVYLIRHHTDEGTQRGAGLCVGSRPAGPGGGAGHRGWLALQRPTGDR